MKKNYNQPIVEVAEVFATSLMQSASPAISNGGDTSSSGIGGGTPIGD